MTQRLLTVVFAIAVCYGRGDPEVELLKWPPTKIRVLTGSTVELVWRFRVLPQDKLRYTSWYFLNAEENRKTTNKIFRKNHITDEEPKMNPTLDEGRKNRSSCDFSRAKGHIWTMKCRIVRANAEDSDHYGIQLMVEGSEPLHNTSSLEVVDIMLNRKDSDVVVESWIGRKTELNCAIHRKVNLTTKYEWSVVTEAKDITRSITKTPTKTSYTFIPLSKRDFGKYKCKISTASTVEEHTIDLKQIGYADAPRELKVKNSDGKISLNWERPLYYGGTALIDFVVETWSDRARKWETIGSTTRSSVTVTKLKSVPSKLRVCSRNKVGIDPSRSCAEKEIPTAQPQRVNSGGSFTIWRYLWIFPLFFTVT